MNAKPLAGSVLSGLSLLAAVVNARARHLFFAAFHVARGGALEGTGTVDAGPYATPEATRLFLGTRLALWTLLAVGLDLLAWGSRRSTTGAEPTGRRRDRSARRRPS